jgi:hypothetical protein
LKAHSLHNPISSNGVSSSEKGGMSLTELVCTQKAEVATGGLRALWRPYVTIHLIKREDNQFCGNVTFAGMKIQIAKMSVKNVEA